jgi:hypothetical protein
MLGSLIVLEMAGSGQEERCRERERLAAHLAKTDRLASRFEAKRAANAARNKQRAAG